jgi:hypothetical protein
MARWRSTSGLLVLLATAACAPLLGDDKPAEDKAPVAKLIKQLGSDDPDERDDAEAALRKLGSAVIDAVRKASNSPDGEIRRRARKLAVVIEQQAIADSLLAPKKVRLKLEDVTVAEAVAQLGKLSGYRIDVNSEAVAKRKVTLTTGEVTFNEALDALCKKAQITQSHTLSTSKGKKGGRDRNVTEKSEPEVIVLRDGLPADGPTAYVGSVRLRVLPRAKTKRDNLFALPIEAAAEPRLREFRVVRVVIEKATDDQGQALDFVADHEGPAKKGRGDTTSERLGPLRKSSLQDRTATVGLKKGQKPAGSLRELSGYVIVSALHEFGPLAALDDVLKSAGKSASGKAGYSLKVDSVERLEDGKGEVKVTATVTLPLSGELDVSGLRNRLDNVNGPGSPSLGIGGRIPPSVRLFDNKGRPWALVGTSGRTHKLAKDRREYTVTLRYRPPESGAKAAHLRLYVTEPAGVAVPFTLKDVPLK